MPSLEQLRAAAETAEKAFDYACRAHYADCRWGYYRALENRERNIPKECDAAFDRYYAALHAFYAARDGEKGFLGSRGC